MTSWPFGPKATTTFLSCLNFFLKNCLLCWTNWDGASLKIHLHEKNRCPDERSTKLFWSVIGMILLMTWKKAMNKEYWVSLSVASAILTDVVLLKVQVSAISSTRRQRSCFDCYWKASCEKQFIHFYCLIEHRALYDAYLVQSCHWKQQNERVLRSDYFNSSKRLDLVGRSSGYLLGWTKAMVLDLKRTHCWWPPITTQHNCLACSRWQSLRPFAEGHLRFHSWPVVVLDQRPFAHHKISEFCDWTPWTRIGGDQRFGTTAYPDLDTSEIDTKFASTNLRHPLGLQMKWPRQQCFETWARLKRRLKDFQKKKSDKMWLAKWTLQHCHMISSWKSSKVS